MSRIKALAGKMVTLYRIRKLPRTVPWASKTTSPRHHSKVHLLGKVSRQVVHKVAIQRQLCGKFHSRLFPLGSARTLLRLYHSLGLATLS